MEEDAEGATHDAQVYQYARAYTLQGPQAAQAQASVPVQGVTVAQPQASGGSRLVGRLLLLAAVGGAAWLAYRWWSKRKTKRKANARKRSRAVDDDCDEDEEE